jgi:PAS domain S-box-containing protein
VSENPSVHNLQVMVPISDIIRSKDEIESILNKSPVVLYLSRAEESFPIELITSNVSQFGYTPDDFYSGRISFTEIVHPDDLQRIETELQSYCAEKQNQTGFVQEYRVRTASGEYIWVNDYTQLRRNNKGEITHLQGIILDIISRKNAEKALKDNLTFLDTLMENIPNPIFYKDRNGIYQGCNKAFAEKILGLPKEQIIGRSVFDLSNAIPDEQARIYHEHDMELIRHPGVQTYETKVKCADGIFYDFYFSKSTFADSTGEVAGIVGVMLDITNRRRAEERLARLNKCLLGFGPNPDENINSLVGACGELMGAASALYNRLDNGIIHALGRWNVPPDFKSIDKPEGHICYDVIRQGEDLPILIRNLQQTPYAQSDANVKKYNLQTYIGKAVKSGGVYIGSLCAVYQKDFEPSTEDKEIFCVISSAIGVEEERKQAQQKSSETKRQQEAIINNIPDIAWLKDKQSRFISVNKALLKAAGLSLESVVGKTDLDVWPKDLAEKYRQDDIEVMKTGIQKILEEQFADKEGTRIWIETIKTPIFDQSGEVIGTTGIARDVTGRKENKDQLQKRAYELQVAKEIAEKSAADLSKTVKELSIAKENLERFNSAAVGREMRIIEIKKEINLLLAELGREPKYKVII